MYYILYLFDKPLVQIEFKCDRAVAIKCLSDSLELLPFGSYKVINCNIIFNVETFNAWWQNRKIPQTRHNIKQLKGDVGSVTDLVLKNKGVSLIDCYWLKPLCDNEMWKKVNLYSNLFVANSIFQQNVAKIISPDTTLNGNLSKYWSREGVNTYLYKSVDNCEQRVANEVFATLLHKKQGKKSMAEYVPYKFILVNKAVYSICSNICSENLSMAHARDILNECKLTATL